MKPNAVKEAMIKSALEKGLSDIKKSPDRAIRNLADLGQMFSKGRYQKDFFDKAVAELRDADSAYYKLMMNLVDNVDSDNLIRFGINLGYHALSHGANAIRRTEVTEGYNVPWTILFDKKESGYLKSFDILDAIAQAKDLGIYCFIFYIDKNEAALHDLIDIAAEESACAFFAFISSALVSESVCSELFKCGNIATFISLDAEDRTVKSGAELMTKYQLLFGGYTEKIETIPADVDDYFKALFDNYAISFFAALNNNTACPEKDSLYRSIAEYRFHLKSPIIPIDLINDTVGIDRAISSEACIFLIDANGEMTILNAEDNTIENGGFTQGNFIEEALKEFMPKLGRGATPDRESLIS